MPLGAFEFNFVIQQSSKYSLFPSFQSHTLLALDLSNFIRRLKSREHFFHNPSQSQFADDEDKTVNQEDKRSNLPWKDTNSHWYPNKVKFNRSEGLLHFIQNITNDLKTNLRKNENIFWNKLDTNQLKALLDLAK